MKAIGVIGGLLVLAVLMNGFPVFSFAGGVLGIAGGLFGLVVGLAAGVFGLFVGLAAGLFGTAVAAAAVLLTLGLPFLIVAALVAAVAKLAIA